MSKLYRHRGCESPVLRYMGDAPLVPGTPIRSGDWQRADGSRPLPGERIGECPDCGEPVVMASHWLEEIEPGETP